MICSRTQPNIDNKEVAMAEFKTVAKVSNLEPGGLMQVEEDSDTTVCLANVDGKVYAINGECSHSGGPLGEGELEGTTVICPWHSGEFDVTTGQAIAEPPVDAVTKYDVRIEGDDIQVAVGE
jgi:nitrite reductase/ring-hydroxylating ferredoxin subunit